MADPDEGLTLEELLLREGSLTAVEREARREKHRAETPGASTRYQIETRLGEGAVAVVYRAMDRELQRPVAIKVLRQVSALNEIARKRFHREAQVAGGLSHPNIIAVYDSGEVGGQPYLVMELVEGHSLSSILSARRYEPRAVVQMLEKVARGVAAAHDKGVVHRDLKPANIMVARQDEPKVGDFGLVHLMGAETGLTRTGATLGTPLYMAPEQLSGSAVPLSPATDVYALGAILYEILTGRPPHIGDSLAEIYAKVAQEDPIPPRRLNAKAPRDLETITLKALERDPARRYPHARDFADDLRRHLDGEPVLARRTPWIRMLKWARRHRTATVAAGVLAAALLAVGVGIAVNAARLRARIDDLMAAADRAAKEGRHAEARDAYGQVRALRPGHPVAEARFHEMDRAALAASRKSAASTFVQEGRRAKDEYDRMQRQLGDLHQEEKRLSAEIEPHAGPEKKAPLWAVRRKIRATEEAMTLRYQDIVVAFISALGADPDTREAKEALARHYFAEIGFAELEGDRTQAMMYEKMVRLFDQGEFASRLSREGTIALDTDPPGAHVELFRYQEGEDLRLLPMPMKSLGTTPVAATKVDTGSYLLILKKEGFRDVRYPVSIARGKNHAAAVTLYTEREIGEGFVYVPAGEFAMGGDPQAFSGADSEEILVDGFFISTSEVGSDVYLQFVNDRSFHTGDQAWKRSPRETPGGGQLWLREGDRIVPPKGWENFPAVGISWDDAQAFCRWLSANGGWKGVRLATGPEWEKAARGVDGRIFPWGNHFDWSFAKGGRSRPGRPQLEGRDRFPADESPYGVRDMAGGVREWCADVFPEGGTQRLARGGMWGGVEVVYFRSASRGSYVPALVGPHLGFRLVRPAPRR
jgi:formylglycine-generating enzyme required for sulfatase activity/tRNA A-37 threonylcarbamoyl transferase component Bud32